MTYTDNEEREFSEKYFPTTFYYNSEMAGKANLEEAEKTYNEMMNTNLEFIEEDTWELLREKVINSLQLSKSHNTHAMTWGQAAMMSARHKIIIQGANIFGLLNKRLDAMIEKILSPSFLYNRAKKEAIEDEKRRKEFERHQAEIEKLKAEREQIQAAQTEA
ncbi:22740_t:CDS:2 [Dentiscutata erythropus]|uniref:22740_t:CDS:1 n=1 Tax=Dentiscutata erythropus TaxID=1348616 RepID=A0A9N9J6A4_9GLOM|nr:22740_t:CDS:2 [Dentiscutata erythropus]